MAADHRGQHARWHLVECLSHRRPCSSHLGGQPRLPGLSLVADPRSSSKHHRRTTHRSRSRPGHQLRDGARDGTRDESPVQRTRHHQLHQDKRQPRPTRVRAPTPPLEFVRCAHRCRSCCTRARTPPARSHHRCVVEGRARGAHLCRLQPERSTQNRLRSVVGESAPAGTRVVSVRVG
ncbi:unannotated protein [freshwater metagenome]|uniref:Unannotated protein n=1 Tax=freshwater metagenome TaxID=449393 RepID=A0A6J6XUQ2_9ZZZZ